MADELTPKQEKFAQLYVQLGNASEAYRQAYQSKAKPDVVHVRASELLSNSKVSVRVGEIKQGLRERNRATLDDLLEELEEARVFASKLGQSSTMVSATMGKAKMLGLDKQIIEHQGSLDAPVSKVTIEVIDATKD